MTSVRTRERLIERLLRNGIANQLVLDAIRQTPRHLFVDEALAHHAYEDTALPIGRGQTLSQPYMVARMSELLLAAGPLAKVLEIGTGSGYQTAILAQLVEHVYTVERIKSLHSQARKRLAALKLYNAFFRHADGALGWPAEEMFDGVLLTAASAIVPQQVLAQLAVGGRLVMPVGPAAEQKLVLITRTTGGFERKIKDSAKFVPLLSGIER
jgi:protein-L-isoaspartate(D-aspartate) O-methyltransferase